MSNFLVIQSLLNASKTAVSEPVNRSGIGEFLAKFQTPLSDVFLADDHSTCRQQFLTVTEAHAEAIVEPDSLADDFGGEAVSEVEVGIHFGIPPDHRHAVKSSAALCLRTEYGRKKPSSCPNLPDNYNLTEGVMYKYQPKKDSASQRRPSREDLGEDLDVGANEFDLSRMRNNSIALRNLDGRVLDHAMSSVSSPQMVSLDIFATSNSLDVEGRSDPRSVSATMQDISEGRYEKKHMENLFKKGLAEGSLNYYEQQTPQSGWQKKEAIVKNEIRTVLKRPHADAGGKLYRGLAMSRSEYALLQQTGYVQNYRFSFFSPSKDVAEYFARTSPGEVQIIYELDYSESNPYAEFHLGKISVSDYKKIIDDPHTKFKQRNLEGLTEVIAIPGHVFKVSKQVDAPGKKTNVLSKIFGKGKKHIVTIPLKLDHRTLNPSQMGHSFHI